MAYISITRLFNAINNMFPILFVDCRPASDFATHSFKGAISVPLPDEGDNEAKSAGDVLGVLREALAAQRRSQVALLVVCVPGDADSRCLHRIQHQLAPLIASACAEVELKCPTDGCEILKYDSFVSKYRQCYSFYCGSAIPQPTKRGLKPVYYASEIISDFLFLGDYGNGSSLAELRALGISHVVDATNERLSEAACRDCGGVAYLPVDVWDTPSDPISNHFSAVNEFIGAAAAAAGRVLVHCRAGWSRSPTLVMAYLLHSGASQSLSDAIRTVLRERPMACPNDGFRDQLRSYELQCRGASGNLLASDAAFMQLVGEMNVMWRPPMTSETDFDRIPLASMIGGASGSKAQQLSEFPPESGDSLPSVAPRPVKPFLRRGERAKRTRSDVKE